MSQLAPDPTSQTKRILQNVSVNYLIAGTELLLGVFMLPRLRELTGFSAFILIIDLANKHGTLLQTTTADLRLSGASSLPALSASQRAMTTQRTSSLVRRSAVAFGPTSTLTARPRRRGTPASGTGSRSSATRTLSIRSTKTSSRRLQRNSLQASIEHRPRSAGSARLTTRAARLVTTEVSGSKGRDYGGTITNIPARFEQIS
jgi:hypothetical protein